MTTDDIPSVVEGLDRIDKRIKQEQRHDMRVAIFILSPFWVPIFVAGELLGAILSVFWHGSKVGWEAVALMGRSFFK